MYTAFYGPLQVDFFFLTLCYYFSQMSLSMSEEEQMILGKTNFILCVQFPWFVNVVKERLNTLKIGTLRKHRLPLYAYQ